MPQSAGDPPSVPSKVWDSEENPQLRSALCGPSAQTRLSHLLAQLRHAIHRPIRIREFLRGSTAKRLQRQSAPRLRKACQTYHQWRVEVLGACEALILWRSAVEELAISGAIEALVALYHVLQNMFCSVEWSERRAAEDKDFSRVSGCFLVAAPHTK